MVSGKPPTARLLLLQVTMLNSQLYREMGVSALARNSFAASAASPAQPSP